jgi:phospholipid-binding lipoprotein MlaA
MTNRNDSAIRTRTGLAALGAAVLLSGCATSANPEGSVREVQPCVFSFNDAVDRTALKPAATAYKNVTPTLCRRA